MFHMERKDYKLEIISKLINSKNHIRGLAKNLNTNHTLIVRKMNELEKNNVVDYKQEGKNKVYFLKNNNESRLYVIMTEVYKLLLLQKKHPKLRNIIDKIQKNKKINLAILFGSYAKGLSKKDSDIDIYIETEDRKIKQEIEMINSKISVKIGLYDKTNLLIKEIEKDHTIIKGFESYYEKNELL